MWPRRVLTVAAPAIVLTVAGAAAGLPLLRDRSQQRLERQAEREVTAPRTRRARLLADRRPGSRRCGGPPTRGGRGAGRERRAAARRRPALVPRGSRRRPRLRLARADSAACFALAVPPTPVPSPSNGCRAPTDGRGRVRVAGWAFRTTSCGCASASATTCSSLSSVSAVVCDDAGKLLLGRRADDGRWSVVSGIIKPGEQPATAVVREVREETGVQVEPVRLSSVVSHPHTYPTATAASSSTSASAAGWSAAPPGSTTTSRWPWAGSRRTGCPR